VPEGALLEATEKAPGGGEGADTTYTAWKAEKEEAGEAGSEAENQSQPNRSQPPINRGLETGETGYGDEGDPKPVSNRSHETSETGSSKSGNGQDPVAPDRADAAAQAAKEFLERLKKGNPPAAA
jgi:hypothetical protein